MAKLICEPVASLTISLQEVSIFLREFSFMMSPTRRFRVCDMQEYPCKKLYFFSISDLAFSIGAALYVTIPRNFTGPVSSTALIISSDIYSPVCRSGSVESVLYKTGLGVVRTKFSTA